jgi:hypothetical protein
VGGGRLANAAMVEMRFKVFFINIC